MGRSVQLPEFADLGALPASDWGVRAFGRSRMRITIFNGPAADLGAVQPEGEQSCSVPRFSVELIPLAYRVKREAMTDCPAVVLSC